MRAAIALGSNLPSRFGLPADNLREATRRLQDVGSVLAVSSLYETDPVGFADQPRFTNAALLLETELEPLPLLRALLTIERAMGRVRRDDLPAKGPRVIDLDLLLYTDSTGRALVLDDPDLHLPHPEMHRRRFVLEPLAEIAPDMLHPVLSRSVRELFEGVLAEGPAQTAEDGPVSAT
jgi:2-amino-4-hydroxy-6-hydroxymethyldihydropteridine diphosphokinase